MMVMIDDVRMICITSTVISIEIIPHISAYFSALQPYFSLPLSVAPLTQCIFSLDLTCYISYIIIMNSHIISMMITMMMDVDDNDGYLSTKV